MNSEALVTRADDLGYRVSDQQLLTEMSHIPQLQVDGKWDLAHALAMLKAQGRPIAQIEDMIRHDAKLRQLDSAFSASSFVTPAELARLRALTRQQREIAWLTIPAAKLAAEATPDDAAVKAYYDAHKSQYMTPETVNLRYVEVSLANLAKQGSRRRCPAQGVLRRAEGEDARALHAARAAPRAAHSVPGLGSQGRCGREGQGRGGAEARAERRGLRQARAGAFAGHRARRRTAAISAGRSARAMSARSPMPPSA